MNSTHDFYEKSIILEGTIQKTNKILKTNHIIEFIENSDKVRNL